MDADKIKTQNNSQKSGMSKEIEFINNEKKETFPKKSKWAILRPIKTSRRIQLLLKKSKSVLMSLSALLIITKSFLTFASPL